MTTLQNRKCQSPFQRGISSRSVRRVLCETLEPRLLLSAADPSGQEQELLWLLNRMRTAPAAELDKLLGQTDFYVDEAMTYFKVDRTVLAQQWTSLVPVQPVAWNTNLAVAAAAHTAVMSQQ